MNDKEDKKALAEGFKQPAPEVGKAAQIAIRDAETRGGIALRNLEDLQRFAKMAVDAEITPKGMTPAGAAMCIQAGLEHGLSVLGGLQQLVPINGNISWRGTGAWAKIQNSGLCLPGTLQKWVEGEGDDRKGVCVAHRVGYKKPFRVEFSLKDARKAGLWPGKDGSAWRCYPDRQLGWRAVGFMAKDYFSDVLGGFPIAEEAEDYPRAEAEERPIVTSSPPPKVADPMLEALGVEQKIEKAEEVIEGEVIDVGTPEEIENATADETPFVSHEEADKELAKQEGLQFPE